MKKLLRNLSLAFASVGLLALASPATACDGHKADKQQTTTNTTDTKKQAEPVAKPDPNKAPASKNTRPST